MDYRLNVENIDCSNGLKIETTTGTSIYADEDAFVTVDTPYVVQGSQAVPLKELTWQRDTITNECSFKGKANNEDMMNPSAMFKAFGDLFSDNFLNGLKEGAKRLALAQSFFAIKRVIFSKPKTIVLWEDGTKTIVSCSLHDIYDKRVALMYAMMQKLFGNSTRMHKFFDQYCEAADYLDPEIMSDVVDDFTERRKKYEQLMAEKEAAKIAKTDPDVE